MTKLVKKKTISKMKAWLIRWLPDPKRSPISENERVAAILDSRKSDVYIRELTELLYANSQLDLTGRISHAKHIKDFYQAHTSIEGSMMCGTTWPFLLAERVTDLQVKRYKNGKELLRFKPIRLSPDQVAWIKARQLENNR